jgi:hypothetical protein
MSLRTFLVFGTLFISAHAMAVCLDTKNNKSSEFMKVNQKECLKQAHFILAAPALEETKTESFRAQLVQPESKKDGLVNGSVVYCRFFYQSQNGESAKFRCALTNEKNQLLDSKGQLVAEAAGLVAEGEDVYLTSANGQKLSRQNEAGEIKPIKADIMKVRYQLGDDRNLENYTSSAASRIFWALGIPAHSQYMTEKVVCFGCNPHPFEKQKSPVVSGGQYRVQEFVDASVEVKFKGSRIFSPTEHAWKWAELNDLQRHTSDDIRNEIEVFALASQFLGAIGKTDMQNAIVCTKFSKARPDECEQVVGMSHDLGAAFGVRLIDKKKTLPRGDLSSFVQARIFKPGTCQFSYSDGGKELPDRVSRGAQQEFLRRALALSSENLKTIMAASHMGHLKNLPLKQSSSSLEDQWVQAVQDKIREVQSAPCN